MKSVAIILSILMIGCSGCVAPTKHVRQHPNITAEEFRATCTEPEEVYNVPPFRFPIPAQVVRHKDCMGISDLFIVAWPGELSEKNLTAAKLLMLMYLEHNSTASFSGITGKFLKVDKVLTPDGDTIGMAFYELNKIINKAEDEDK